MQFSTQLQQATKTDIRTSDTAMSNVRFVNKYIALLVASAFVPTLLMLSIAIKLVVTSASMLCILLLISNTPPRIIKS